MKRTIAAGLSAALLCGMVVPAFAADTKTATNTTQTQPTAPVKLTFDKLEETVRQNNVTIKANNNTVLSAEKTDVSDQYIESYFQLSEQISSYQKQIKELQKTLKELGTDEVNAGLRKTLESQISILQRNLAHDGQLVHHLLGADLLEDANHQVCEDDAEEDQEKTVDHTRRQMQNAADEICLSAENTYISLRGMKYTLNQTNRSIQQLDRNIATVQKQVKLGMTGVNTLKSLQAQRESAVAGKASLTTQVEALTNTLAIQCGYTTGTQIETSDLPVVTAEQVTSIDYNKDLAEALKNSYAIYSKEYAMQTASDDYENNKTNTLYAYQAAKIDRDAQKESTTASFRKLYTDLQEKQTALAAADADLAQAKKTFTVSQVQYTRGMISKMAYTDALDTFTTAQETEVAARIDLLTAYNTYQWAKRGVITATT